MSKQLGITSKFQKGSATYTCMSCDKLTRKVGDEPHGMCNDCYEQGGSDNAVSDNIGWDCIATMSPADIAEQMSEHSVWCGHVVPMFAEHNLSPDLAAAVVAAWPN